jgi:hypothetical protein
MNVKTHMNEVPEEKVLGDRDEIVSDPEGEILRLCWLQWNAERLKYGGVRRVLPAPFPPPPILKERHHYADKLTAKMPSMTRETLHNMIRSNKDNVG